ncbi:MAG: phosphotransferase family protein, partial [Flavobacteriales bacterium]
MSVSIDKAKEVRKGEGIDAAVLSAYLGKALDKPEGEVVIKQFPSGFSNLTYLITFGEQEYVLRRPPFGANIKSGHDMSR